MTRYNHPRKTLEYSADITVKAIELSYQEGIEVQQGTAGVDMHPFKLSRWRKEYRQGRIRSDGQKRVDVMKEKGVTG